MILMPGAEGDEQSAWQKMALYIDESWPEAR